MDDGNDYLRKWQRKKKNEAQDYTYEYPGLPPYVRIHRAVNRCLFFLKWFSGYSCIVYLLAAGGVQYFFGKEVFGISFIVFMVIFFVSFVLLFVEETAWRCTGCGKGFPYYSVGRSRILKREDVMNSIMCSGIEYMKPRCCTLILPCECPYCKKKYFKKSAVSIPGESQKRTGKTHPRTGFLQ